MAVKMSVGGQASKYPRAQTNARGCGEGMRASVYLEKATVLGAGCCCMRRLIAARGRAVGTPPGAWKAPAAPAVARTESATRASIFAGGNGGRDTELGRFGHVARAVDFPKSLKDGLTIKPDIRI